MYMNKKIKIDMDLPNSLGQNYNENNYKLKIEHIYYGPSN